MYYQIKSYIKFLLRSSNQHGIHSPFVYDLITKCLYNKKSFSEYDTLTDYRKALLKSSESIEIKDFGQGSRVFKSDVRKISEIAKNAGIKAKRQRLLFRLVRFFNSENMLELGTSLGLATAAMSLGNPAARIDTVEGCANTSEKAQQFFDHFNLKNIRLHGMSFEKYFTSVSEEKTISASEKPSKTYDLVYIDGNHNKEKTLQYFEILLKHSTNKTVFIFDDIYWSPEMTKAWKEIIELPKVTVSIDTFYWGLVFFRSEQPKQHFNIRL
ncbi:O-methyltransferase [Ulvibacter antarcticus]|uniref:Methyltransferase family protein n=1 Tax=Ulvibacter antarcticus TaxID=442714 RepID=A0A3L9YC56_9FLAO|nr:class I SAM-dependent methyltransferase [Ulvibacter antarcticus]RMA57954.1 methyltransferase family protein [Ulvibacter antarcticus]